LSDREAARRNKQLRFFIKKMPLELANALLNFDSCANGLRMRRKGIWCKV
jgi:hypothetical protein